MERDVTLFPENEIGDYLWNAVNVGVDIAKAVEIEFTVIFKDQEQALKFGQLLLENNQKLSMCHFEENETHPWEITAYPMTSASYANIIAYKNLLVEGATPFEGLFDGFYFPTH
jgi:hypothetical protein